MAGPFSTSFIYILLFIFYAGVQYIFLIVYHSSSTHSSRLTSQISLLTLISLNFSSKFKFFLATMDLHQARCEAKPSPACEHAVPTIRAELLIRTIAETNMTLWTFGRPGQL